MEDIAILGVGMHPWGKWGRNFVEYGTVAAKKALDDAQIEWNEVGFIVRFLGFLKITTNPSVFRDFTSHFRCM